FEGARGIFDAAGGDDDDPFAVIFPRAGAALGPVIAAPAHDDRADGPDEAATVVLAQIEVGLLGEPVEILVRRGDEAVETGSDIAEDPGQGQASLWVKGNGEAGTAPRQILSAWYDRAMETTIF